MKDPNRLWSLIARKLAGEASAEELQELRELLKENPDTHFSVQVLSDLWDRSQQGIDLPETEKAFQRIGERLAKRRAASAENQPSAPAMPKSFSERPGILYPAVNWNSMLSNYFKTAWRNLVRNKAFSLINISGLAIGMAAATLILLWIQNELSLDQFHKNKDRVYQVYCRGTFDGQLESWNGTSMLLAPELEMNYPEVEATARTNPVSAFIFHAGEKHLGSHGMLTDPGFLKIFDFPLLQGNVNTALNSARSLVITETFAKKLFGDSDAMGKMVRIDSSANFMVTGILKDLPNNTVFDFEYLVPWSYMKEVHWDRPKWETNEINTLVLLKPGVSEERANARFANIARLHTKEANYDLFLYPMPKWHLWRLENGKITAGHIRTVRLFGAIAGFILLIACINYMNLSTARSVKRAREVGIRKVAGAGKGSLVGQFLGESILMALIAGAIALLIVKPNLGWFNQLTNKALFIPYSNPYFWLAAIGFILFTGILAGSYPAFYLSAFKPIRVLKGSFKAVNALVTPRKIMVVVQFTFAIILITCTLVIYRQIKYGQARDSGFSRDNLAFVYIKGDMRKYYAAIRQELMNSGAITSITQTNSPVTETWNGDRYEWPGQRPDQKELGFIKYHTDRHFAQTMGLKIIAGRDIDAEKYPTDSTAILLSESAAKRMGFKDPVGQPVKSDEGNWHVIGVVKDFAPGNPFAPEYPVVIQGPGPHHWYGTMTFKLNGQRATSDNLKAIGSVLKKYAPDYPFEYYFTDQMFAMKFLDEKRTATLAAIFAGLTIFISCLGLFALATYMAENRIKEIGVRKVLGASVSAISALLSKDFLKLVIISFAIASPVAWWAMHSWLQNYPYHITINWWVFALTGLLSMLIAIITVSYQAIKAALANPVKSLRTE